MKTLLKAILVVVGSLGLSGCYTFSNVANVDEPVPSYWSNRNYVDPSVAGPANTSIDWFAGRVAYKGGDGKYYFGRKIFKGKAELKVQAVQSAFQYSSISSKNFATSASFPFVSGDSTGEYVNKYEVKDIANIIVSDENEPERAAVLADLPKAVKDAPIWWVSSVGLSTVRQERARNMHSGTKVTGTGYSVDGSVYDGTSQATYYPLTSIAVLPMNAAADTILAALPASKAEKKIADSTILKDALGAVSAMKMDNMMVVPELPRSVKLHSGPSGFLEALREVE